MSLPKFTTRHLLRALSSDMDVLRAFFFVLVIAGILVALVSMLLSPTIAHSSL